MDIPPEVYKALPGAIGSAIALRWIEGSWSLKITTWAGGGAIAYYGGSFLAWWLQITHAGAISFIGLALGLFGMICAGKIYEGIAKLDVQKTVETVLDFVLRRKSGGG